MDTVTLGTTGLRVSRLAFGTGTHGWAHHSQQTALGVEGLAGLLTLGFERGVTFWDLADQYGSHPHAARALQDVPRDEVVIATKTTSRNRRGTAKDVDRFLKEIGTDVIDIVLLHFLHGGNWPRKYSGAMAALTEAKDAGKVRAVGVSCHNLAALRTAVTTPWVEVVLARINYAGVNMDGSPSEVVPVLNKLHEAGKGVYGMKVLGCGQLTSDVQRAFRYVLDLGTVDAMTVGMSSRAQLLENVEIVQGLSPSRMSQ
jgi:aryl-alcohol dehydrogenase-like predicted oxidoreductase